MGMITVYVYLNENSNKTRKLRVSLFRVFFVFFCFLLYYKKKCSCNEGVKNTFNILQCCVYKMVLKL